MRTIELIENLKAKDVHFSVDDNRRLHCDGPSEVMTAELQRQLAAVKGEIIRYCESPKKVVVDRLNRSKTIGLQWTRETDELIDWFQSHSDNLPLGRFDLRPWATVVNPRKFYESLDRDIETGPMGARARLGGLLSDLKCLRELMARPKSG